MLWYISHCMTASLHFTAVNNLYHSCWLKLTLWAILYIATSPEQQWKLQHVLLDYLSSIFSQNGGIFIYFHGHFQGQTQFNFLSGLCPFKMLRTEQNNSHFPNGILKCYSVKEKFSNSIWISLKLHPKHLIDKKLTLAYRCAGDKPIPKTNANLVHRHIYASPCLSELDLV